MLFVVIFRSLAAEWGRYGMRFNVIQPGPIKTKVGLLVACECEGDTGVCADVVGGRSGRPVSRAGRGGVRTLQAERLAGGRPPSTQCLIYWELSCHQLWHFV